MSGTAKRTFDLTEVCALTGVNEPIVLIYVEREWIAPALREHPVLFDEEDVARIRLIRELQTDLGVNDESVPLVLHLLDQIYHLRAHLRRLTRP